MSEEDDAISENFSTGFDSYKEELPVLDKSDPLIDDIAREIFDYNIDLMSYANLIIIQIIRAPHYAFMNGNHEAGLNSIVFGVDQLEHVCISAKVIDKKKYEDEVKVKREDLKKDEAYLESSKLLQQAKMSNLKFEILLTAIDTKKPRKVELVA